MKRSVLFLVLNPMYLGSIRDRYYKLYKLFCALIKVNTFLFQFSGGGPYDNRVFENHGSVRVHTTSNGVIEQENNVNRSLQELKELNARNLKVIELGTSDETINILHKQLQTLNEINDYISQKRKLEHSVSEWQKLAKVVDRLFMILFSLIQVGTTCGILIRIANADTLKELEVI